MGQPVEQYTQHTAPPDVQDGSVMDFAGDYPGIMVVAVSVLFGAVVYLVKLKRGRR